MAAIKHNNTMQDDNNTEQDEELWISVTDNYRETDKRHNFNDYESF